MCARNTTSCKCEVTTDTLHNLGSKPRCKSMTASGYVMYTFKYCRPLTWGAGVPCAVTTPGSMAVVGALAPHPMVMSATLSYLRMHTHTHTHTHTHMHLKHSGSQPSNTQEPNVSHMWQSRCHKICCYTRGRCVDPDRGEGQKIQLLLFAMSIVQC
jgi:hypothetical protein